MALKLFLLFAMSVTLARGQRPGFAGTKPIGYPELYDKPTTEALGDRFGEDGTTQKLPLEANGDRDLIDRLSKLPIDQQPFWFINWQALEENRKKPQTYPQKPNDFVDPIFNAGTVSGTNSLANRGGSTNSNTKGSTPNTFSGVSTQTNTNTESNQVANNGANLNSGTVNRFGTEPSSNVASTSTVAYQGVSSATPNKNSGIENRFSETQTTNKGGNYGDDINRYSGHKQFRPRTPIVDN